MPVVAAALFVGLLPAQSFALPPDPAKAETGRESLTLEKLEDEEPVPGTVAKRNLAALRARVPAEMLAAPTNTVNPPSNLNGSVPFGSSAGSASAQKTNSAAQAAGLTPVGSLPVSLGQASGHPAPTGTWHVSIPDRAEEISQGVDGAVLVVQAPDAGAVPVSARLDYAKFELLYGADWASRLRFVQFPDCYLTTPNDEACQTYEELETLNDTASKSLTATIDPAADTGATPASADGTPEKNSGVVQAGYRKDTATSAAAAASTAVVGAIDSGKGAGGSFTATPLAADGKWQAGGSSGAFTWSYPLTVPSPPAGPTPSVSFDYNSQTVDGRTAVSSPQSSWIGEGWSYDPGHIERRYRTCQDDRKTLTAGTPNNTATKDKTTDLCWVSYNAVMSLRGKTTELVRDAASGSNPEQDTEVYRPQQDDGTRVERRVGGTNGDNNGEYWVVTTTDGTRYYYGLNQVGGGHADTGSVSTVPVFGNHPNEPCHTNSFADSRCGTGKQQAWRWGLDKVVDVHGNTMIVNWKQETNYYAVRKKFTSPERYDRYAYPASIEYGMRPDSLTKPSATVDFGAKQRCLRSDTACDPDNFAKTDDPGAYRPWWDTPGNLNCKSTSDLCPAFPSFWTQLRLDTVTTKAARAGQTGLGKVDQYTLRQSFPEDWYDTSPGLWLNSITRTGYAPGDNTGTLQSKDGISFTQYTVGTQAPKEMQARLLDRQLPNLVTNGKADQRPGYTRPRIGTISTSNGADIEIEYTGGCASEPAEDKGEDNGTCYPVRWSPDGDEKTPAKAWFNKYVVDSVTETDKVTSHGRPVTTQYAYTGPAWAKSDDEFTRTALHTYSDWRGYRQVAATKGSKSSSTTAGITQSQSYSETRYFQGVGGAVKDSTQAYTLLADDAPQYAGMTAESITYKDSSKDPDGIRPIAKRTLNFPWSKQTASRPREAENGTELEPLLAHRTGIKRTDEIQKADSSWRAVRTLTEVDDTYGLPTQVETAVVKPNGTGETLSEQTCTVTSYVHNTTTWLIGLPKKQRSTGTTCAAHDTADPKTRLIKDVQLSYDGLGHGQTPTKGLVTSSAEANGDGISNSVVTTSTYDPLGRIRKITKPGAGVTETQYTPADEGGPVTSMKVINAKGHTVTTTLDPGRSLALTVTDANGRVSRNEYDALGRLIKGWSPSRSSGNQSPNVEIAYQTAAATPSKALPPAVTTRTLKDDGTYSTQVTIYDGLLRPVQTQSEAHGPGRIITGTTYNDHGLVHEQTAGYLAKGEPVTELFAPKSLSLIPSWLHHRYDGLERPVRVATYHSGTYVHAAHTTYYDTSTYVNPAGSTAPRTRTYTDTLGRVTSIRHYSDDTSNNGRVTAYEYDARGHRTGVVDPAGNTWTYEYDARGRLTSATDPDTGTTDTGYDTADRPNHIKNARQQETFTEYDLLGRVTKVREGSATSTPVKEYTYDDAPGGIGQPYTSKRHTDTGDYTNRITGYDTEYRPTGTETVIPANSMTTGLAGTYANTYTYTPTGKLQSVTLPAAGGLAKEKVVNRYTSDGLPESTSGLTWYTADATHSPYGEVLRTVSGPQPHRVWTTNFTDPHTGRLQRTVTDRETSGPHRITDSYYSYDASGLITSNSRNHGDAAQGVWDTQCFTYDVMGELAHAWTSNMTPTGNATGCKAANGTTWGHRTNYQNSSGPVADAPDAQTDAETPDTSLAASLAAAAPDATTLSTGTTAYRQSFTFDWIGNRATMTEHDTADPSKNTKYTYGYGKTVTNNGTTAAATAQPHTMTSIASTPAGKNSTYRYDATGNTEIRNLHDTSQSLVWTQENKLDSITDDGTKTTYVYDAGGNRLLENSPSGSTLYLGETELTTNASGTITRASRSYTQPGAPTVVRTTNNGATTGHKLNVLIADHLGTANTAVELSTTQPMTRREFKPYGELRGTKPTTWPNKRTYLGVGIDDQATGLTHIGAREYDQNSGRFLSADPIIDIANPLQMNGYAYSSNSPITNSDPTGLCSDLDCPTRPSPDYQNTTPGHEPGKPTKSANTLYAENGESYSSPGGTANSGRPGNRTKSTVYNTTPPTYQYQSTNGVCVWATASSCSSVASSADEVPIPDLPCLEGDSLCDTRNHLYKFGVETGMTGGSLGFFAARPGIRWYKGGRARVGANCNNCFLAGTGVLMADGSSKAIEDVIVGDTVQAADPETGESGPRKVTHLIVTRHDKHFNDLSIATEDGIEKLTATHEHPFWSPSQDAWVDAANLTPGMTLLTDDGTTVIITDNKAFTRAATTYNLTVDDLHTYYVLAGATPVLVHNSGGCNVADGPRLQARLAAEELAGADGHAFQKHVVEQGEFPGIRTRAQFADMIEGVILNGERRVRSDGASAYWRNGVIVIRNPRSRDGGTVFAPQEGYRYFTRNFRSE
ncbi:hypothetical protein DN051_40150 [Streptomyces cadmiisoli]|uniref:Hint domain-containing protein n=1 Tax=Streptomyces cadmiisoli TaxID=2184053 RepID=A0A2Z4JAA6_9ACTN|nr:hypothetical protein DN051_00660 [Streptomyces cadmiisoli]AWW42980.1 hypothetical protein DN051_40150 [Streptomyces cadmiisoli]